LLPSACLGRFNDLPQRVEAESRRPEPLTCSAAAWLQDGSLGAVAAASAQPRVVPPAPQNRIAQALAETEADKRHDSDAVIVPTSPRPAAARKDPAIAVISAEEGFRLPDLVRVDIDNDNRTTSPSCRIPVGGRLSRS
jgi:hypothetical protein